MSEPKVIELTAEEFDLFQINDRKREIHEALQSGQDVLLKSPQPKLVHLSDLPDGTVVKVTFATYDREVFAVKGWLYMNKAGESGVYSGKIADDIVREIELIQGELLPWQGGECPWPAFVEVEVMFRYGETGKGRATDYVWEHGIRDIVKNDEIIAHRCTGRLLDGAKLVP